MSVFRDEILKDRHAFVAGGTSGINLGIATRFAHLGAQVTVIGRNPDKAQAAALSIGPQAVGRSCDVRDYDGVDRALADSVARFGPIDFLVSGAAGNFLSRAETLSATHSAPWWTST